MLAKVLSGAVVGIDATLVEVEVDISFGLPSFSTVGLPEAAVRESKDRVKAALGNSGYEFPDDRIIVNLAPADLKKEGTGFDLPIAIGILAATGLIPPKLLGRFMLLGELSLDGRVKPVRGALPLAVAAKENNLAGFIPPLDNAREAAVVRGLDVLGAAHLSQVVDFLRGMANMEPARVDVNQIFSRAQNQSREDFAEVQGQEFAKRALEVAAAGGHNVLMAGPPGSGKTMLAKRLPTILPPLSFEESVTTTKIHSVAGRLKKNEPLVVRRPFRPPHHTISDAGLIGGGQVPRPGEVSLAHNGVLFLDELPEFKKHVLEVLRQPLEDRTVTISRAALSITYPASFMLIGAMNPCPCGFLTDPRHECTCSPLQVKNYKGRISGPLMDRLDIHVEVPAVAYKDLSATTRGEPSAVIRERVQAAREIQYRRFSRARIFTNAQMASRHLKKYCQVDPASQSLLETAVDRLGMSARGYNRVLKIARTIADLDRAEAILSQHVAEAVGYRGLDRAGG